MHKTLKAETARPPAGSARGQQARFNGFRREFNEERPHEALGQETPESVYERSPRQFPRKLPPICYPGHYEVRYVSENGAIRWKRAWVGVTTVLAHEHIGLEEVGDGAVGRILQPTEARSTRREADADRGSVRSLDKVGATVTYCPRTKPSPMSPTEHRGLET